MNKQNAIIAASTVETVIVAEKHIRNTRSLLDQATEIGVLVMKQSLLGEFAGLKDFFKDKDITSEDKVTLDREHNKLRIAFTETNKQLNQLLIPTVVLAHISSISQEDLLAQVLALEPAA